MTCSYSTLEEIMNMVKITASNQRQNAVEMKREIKDEIKAVKHLIATGIKDTNETRLKDAVKEIQDEVKV